MIQSNAFPRTAGKIPASKNRFEAPVQETITSKDEFYKKVAEKAYELYVARGRKNGHDREDWAKAEQILKSS